MDFVLTTVQEIVYGLTQVGIVLFQFVAVIIMVHSCIDTMIRIFKRKQHTVIRLRKSMNVALLFILCSEILRLTRVHTLEEVGVIFFIIVIHVIISVLSHWEMKHDIETHKEHEAAHIDDMINDECGNINL